MKQHHVTAATALLTLGFAAGALAQSPAPAPAPPTLAAHQLTPSVYWISGSGGNSGVIIGERGVVVIDAKTTAAGGKQLLAEIAKLTPKPVTTVILTHSDSDHVNGLAAFPTGLRIIGHENNRKEQERALAAGAGNAPSARHLPTVLIAKGRESMTLEGVRFDFHYWGKAHTSGDIVVALPADKIAFTGDLIDQPGFDPRIHQEKDGITLGWIAAAKGMLEIDATQYVTGHGPVHSKAEIAARVASAERKREQIRALVQQGQSLEQVKIAMDDTKPVGRVPYPSYTEVVYTELTRK